MFSPPSPGGFFQPAILTPPASVASSAAQPGLSRALPHPRSSPLKPGGSKESALIRHVDQRLLAIQRRFAKRQSSVSDVGSARGYASFAEAATELSELVDLVWVSGTPALQVPYLLSIALLVTDYIPAFPPSRKSMFILLGKLDHAFASLLQGRDVDTGEPLSGVASGRVVSGTEKVRIKSLVERTRICVVEAANNAIQDTDDEIEADTDMGTDTEMELERAHESTDSQREHDLYLPEADDYEMEIAKVYDKTVVELGDTIGGSPIGIVTD